MDSLSSAGERNIPSDVCFNAHGDGIFLFSSPDHFFESVLKYLRRIFYNLVRTGGIPFRCTSGKQEISVNSAGHQLLHFVHEVEHVFCRCFAPFFSADVLNKVQKRIDTFRILLQKPLPCIHVNHHRYVPVRSVFLI